ncbi:MAG: hypothetical protein U5K54_05095 [Cytophagales bacterium]|nr:hypothetical protein [Cytophagales bacterium]
MTLMFEPIEIDLDDMDKEHLPNEDDFEMDMDHDLDDEDEDRVSSRTSF